MPCPAFCQYDFVSALMAQKLKKESETMMNEHSMWPCVRLLPTYKHILPEQGCSFLRHQLFFCKNSHAESSWRLLKKEQIQFTTFHLVNSSYDVSRSIGVVNNARHNYYKKVLLKTLGTVVGINC